MSEKYYQDGIEIPTTEKEEEILQILQKELHKYWWKGFENAIDLVMNEINHADVMGATYYILRENIENAVNRHKNDE